MRRPLSRTAGSMSIGTHVIRTLQLALPVMLSRAGLLALAVADSIMTGRVNATQLAYYAIGLAPQIPLMLIGIGSLLGTVVLTAQADGAGRCNECGAVWRVALVHAAGYGAVLLLICYAGEHFLLLVGQSPDLARGGGGVMVMFGWSMPAMLMFVATMMFLEGINRPSIGIAIVLLANLLNVLLNWLLIYGHWGLPAMGAAGAALATTLVRWCMVAAAIGFVIAAIDRQRYGIAAPIAHAADLGRRLRRIGYPMALTQGLESSGFATITLFSGWMGAVQVAAFQINMSLISLVFMSALGFATAASVRVGNAVGREDPIGLRRAGWVAAALVVVVLTFWALLFYNIPADLAALYTNEGQVLVVATAALTLAALVLIPDGYQAVLMGALRGMADVWLPTLLFLIAFWLVMIPAGYLLGVVRGGGAAGLVVAVVLGCVTASVLLSVRFHIVSKRAIARV